MRQAVRVAHLRGVALCRRIRGPPGRRYRTGAHAAARVWQWPSVTVATSLTCDRPPIAAGRRHWLNPDARVQLLGSGACQLDGPGLRLGPKRRTTVRLGCLRARQDWET